MSNEAVAGAHPAGSGTTPGGGGADGGSAGRARAAGPLGGTVVLDIATLFAGPMAATMLADFGAEVVKVEHPRKSDALRHHGQRQGDVSLWWKALARNKKTVTLDLSRPAGAGILLRLVERADVLIENFRPGTLERWGLGPDRLHQVNPGLIVGRVTGFGQHGPYSGRPGFGTLAEAMSGFAAMTGEPDGPPILPPFALADSIAAQSLTSAVLMALYHRDVHGGPGQVVDLAIIEPMLAALGPQPTVYDRTGLVPLRTGNRTVNNAPRNIYRCADGRYVAVSTSAQSVAERVMTLVGHPEVISEPWFASGHTRAEHTEELDADVGAWVAERTLPEVVEAFEKAQAAVAPVYDIADVMADPQYQALGTIVEVDDDELGRLRMQNVLFRLSATPGAVAWAGRRQGQDNAEVYGSLGLSPGELEELARDGII